MKTDILVIPVVVICAVKHGTIAPLQTPDKIQWMYDRKTVQVRDVLGSVTVHGLFKSICRSGANPEKVFCIR